MNQGVRLKKRISICEAIYANLIFSELSVENQKSLKIERSIWTSFEWKIYKQFVKKKEKFLEEIKSFLKKDWELSRLNLTVLAIILEAITEHEVFQTQPAVLIHQSLLISKIYGGESDKLIHALIDSYLKSKLTSQKSKN